MFKMIIAMFEVKNKEKLSRLFEKNLLLTMFSINVVLEILFVTLSNLKMNFVELKIFCRIYTSIKAILITKQIKLIKKKEFIVEVLNLEEKIFIVYIVNLARFNSYIHLF